MKLYSDSPERNVIADKFGIKRSRSSKRNAGRMIEEDEADFQLSMMRSTEKLVPNAPIIAWRPVIGPVIKFFKKLTRKLINWYIVPICENQSKFNSAATDMLEDLEYRLEDVEAKKKQLEKAMEEMNRRLDLCERSFPENSCEYETIDSEENYWNHRMTYSQSGEDAILSYVFRVIGKPISEIRYLDLGANHPRLISNTYWMYKQGASGVLVEANPQLAEKLECYRPKDNVLNCCISEKGGEKIPFYVLSGDGLSTVSKESVDEIQKKNPNIKVNEKIDVDSMTLQTILKEHFPDKAPDVMSIDLEGIDYDILKSIDFSSQRPFAIVCETIEYENRLVISEKRHDIINLLTDNGYVEYAFTGINSIFLDKNVLQKMYGLDETAKENV